MQRRKLLAFASSFAASGFLPALMRSAEAAGPTRGGVLSYARAADSLFLDPVLTEQNADIWISLNLYDMLIQPTSDGKGLQPGLASAWTTSADGKTVTLTLRPNLRFADGSPLALSDVVWSLTRASTPKTGGTFQFLLDSIARVEGHGTDTVILHLRHPDPTILPALATFNSGIMPQKLLMAAPGATLTDKARAFANHPIGSGPFVLSSWQRNSLMVLKRNPYYWKPGADGKNLPYLDEVRLPVIPDDATRVLKLKAGEVDATEFVPFSRVAELKADPKLDMALFPSEKVIYFNLNCRPKFKNGKVNPMASVQVRQALNHATDKQALIQVLSYGFGVPQQSYMPMSTPYAWGHGEPYLYDIAKASQLMKQAGYPNGFEVTCLALAGNADDVAQLTALQQMWSQIHVRLKIEQLENATRLERFKAGDYEMRTSLWTNDINDPSEITSYFCYYPTVQCNRSGFRDLVIEKLFLASQQEMNPEKRTAQYQQIQQRYLSAAPIVFLLEVPYPVAMLKKVHDFVQIPLGDDIYAGAYVTA